MRNHEVWRQCYICGKYYDARSEICHSPKKTTFRLFLMFVLVLLSGQTYGQTYPEDIERNPKKTPYLDSIGVLASVDTVGEHTFYMIDPYQELFVSADGDTLFITGDTINYVLTNALNANNIYNSNGTLEGNRAVTLDGNFLSFDTGVFTIRPSGNIGIGIESPTEPLDMVNSAPEIRLFDSDSADPGDELRVFKQGATGYISLEDESGTATLRIDARPTAGSSNAFIDFFRSTTTTAGLHLRQYDGGGSINNELAAGRPSDDNYFNAVEGDTGIGSDANPEAKLHVFGSTQIDNNLNLNSYGVGTNTGTETYVLAVDATGDVIELDPSTIGTNTNIYTDDGSTPGTRTVTLGGRLHFDDVTIEPGGFVGIGDSDPNTSLDISQDDPWIRMTDTGNSNYFQNRVTSVGKTQYFDDTGQAEFRFDITPVDGTSNAFLRLFRETNTTGSASIILDGATGDGISIGARLFGTAHDSYLQNNGGDFGIGSDADPQAKFHVFGSTQIDDNLNLNSYGVGTNTGTETYLLGVEADGDVVEAALSGFTSHWTLAGNDIYNNNSGNVGIGTTSPTEQLTVDGKIELTHGSNLAIRRNTGNNLIDVFGIDTGTDLLYVQSSGAFEIRNSGGNPHWEFHNGGRLGIQTEGDMDYTLEVSELEGDGYFGITETTDGDIFIINDVGNVGIGTSTPTAAPLSFPNSTGNKIALWGTNSTAHYGLGIQGSELQIYTQVSSADVTIGHGASASFTEKVRFHGTGELTLSDYGSGVTTGTETYLLGVEADGDVIEIDPSAVGTNTNIYTDDGSTPGTRTVTLGGNLNLGNMTIESTGDVGIGTTNPNRTLTLSETVPSLRLTDTNDSDFFQLTQNAGRMEMQHTSQAGAGQIRIDPLVLDGSSIAQISLFRETNTTGSSSLVIYEGDNTAGVQHQFFANTGEVNLASIVGNVGIGTTSPDAKLDVENGNVRFSDYGGGTVTGTETYILGVDADGDVIEIDPATINENIYNTSDALTGARNVDMAGNSLTFESSSGNDIVFGGVTGNIDMDGDFESDGSITSFSGSQFSRLGGNTLSFQGLGGVSYVSSSDFGSDLAFSTNNGSSNDHIYLDGGDVDTEILTDLILSDYGSGSNTGTDAFFLTVNSSGDVLEESIANVLFTSTVFGGDVSGTASNLQLGTGVVGANELDNIITAGSCTSCNITYTEDGRITVASNGTGGGYTDEDAQDAIGNNLAFTSLGADLIYTDNGASSGTFDVDLDIAELTQVTPVPGDEVAIWDASAGVERKIDIEDIGNTLDIPRAYLYDATQTLTSTLTTINFTSSGSTGTLFTPSTGSDRITIGRTGLYFATVTCRLQTNSGSSESVIVQLVDDTGTILYHAPEWTVDSSGGQTNTLSFTVPVNFTLADWIEVKASATGTVFMTETYLTIH